MKLIFFITILLTSVLKFDCSSQIRNKSILEGRLASSAYSIIMQIQFERQNFIEQNLLKKEVLTGNDLINQFNVAENYGYLMNIYMLDTNKLELGFVIEPFNVRILNLPKFEEGIKNREFLYELGQYKIFVSIGPLVEPKVVISLLGFHQLTTDEKYSLSRTETLSKKLFCDSFPRYYFYSLSKGTERIENFLDVEIPSNYRFYSNGRYYVNRDGRRIKVE